MQKCISYRLCFILLGETCRISFCLVSCPFSLGLPTEVYWLPFRYLSLPSFHLQLLRNEYSICLIEVNGYKHLDYHLQVPSGVFGSYSQLAASLLHWLSLGLANQPIFLFSIPIRWERSFLMVFNSLLETTINCMIQNSILIFQQIHQTHQHICC